MQRYYQRRGWLYLGVVCGVLDIALWVVWGLAPTIELALTPSAIQAELGQAYYTVPGPLGLWFPYWLPADNATRPTASQLQLLEDGRPLGPSHSIHQTIRDVGRGAFSYWTGQLYFSTADGTDPRTNGKRYTIRVTAEVVPWVLWGVAAGNMVALAIGRNWLRQVLVGTCARLLLKRVGACVETVDRVFATTPGWRGHLVRIAGLLLPFLVYGVLLHCLLPAKLLFVAYYALTAIALPAGLLLYGVYRWPGWLGTLASLTLTLSLFALPLLALWSHLGLHWNALGELLPWSDASGYYYEARRLLDGHLLGWSVRRPLFTGLLAMLLGVTGQNLQVTLALLVAINAVACFLLARTIQASQGPLAAVLVLLLVFLFYRGEGGLGTTLTENLGLSLGLLSWAVLWQGGRTRRMGHVWLGIGLLTLALMARAGAFFVLLALLVGGAWGQHRQGRSAGRFGLGAALAIALGAGVSLALGHLLADPTNALTAFSNFSQVLYGLVVGGKGWGQVLLDYPQAREGAETYALAWQAFRAHPLGLVSGSLKMWREYFPPNGYHAFAFVQGDAYAVALQMACYVLSAVGLAQCLRRSQPPQYGLVGAATIGHLASIPFAPPIDAGLRVYAATMPLLALLVAIAVGDLRKRVLQWTGMARYFPLRTLPDAAGPGRAPGPGAALVCGLGLAGLVSLGPLVIHLVSHTPRLVESPCPAGQNTVYVRLIPGSGLRIVADPPAGTSIRVTVPAIRVTELRRTVGTVEIKHDLDRFVAGQTMMNTYDLKSGRYVWLLVPTHLVPESSEIARVCGHDSTDADAKSQGVFYAASVYRVAAP